MANHGKGPRTGARAARHYAKKSRAKRHDRRENDRHHVIDLGESAQRTLNDPERSAIIGPDSRRKLKDQIKAANALRAKLDGYKEVAP